jgi:hypothetical protein
MKKLNLLTVTLTFLISTLLVGCAPQADGKPSAVVEKCLRGVTYYISGYQLAPAFNDNGKVLTCPMSESDVPSTVKTICIKTTQYYKSGYQLAPVYRQDSSVSSCAVTHSRMRI